MMTMMTGMFTALVLAAALDRTGQDAVAALPDAYTKQFENEWVRIVRVHYAPLAKLPAHSHNALPAAYVYLNDGGPVRFKHIGTSYGPATRPPTSAGAFRIYRGLDEIHEVENLSDLPSDFLRIEFKTEPRDLAALGGRFPRETAMPGQNLEKVQFENGQVRITRLICRPGRSLQLTAATEPALLVAVHEARFRESNGAETILRTGQERWIAARSALAFENTGSSAVELLRIDLKTPPSGSSKMR